MKTITPCLWFDGRAEEAARFYTSVFKDGRIDAVTHYDDAASKAAQQPAGSVMTVLFTVHGQTFLALNGGPMFQFTPAISLMVDCDTQEEIDYFWDKLAEGGQHSQCGWLQDKFGLSWQIVPKQLGEWTKSGSPEQMARIMKEGITMTKLDIARLEKAYAG